MPDHPTATAEPELRAPEKHASRNLGLAESGIHAGTDNTNLCKCPDSRPRSSDLLIPHQPAFSYKSFAFF
jgi:hypothetical protein